MVRPRNFSREGVLERALPVFWKHGSAEPLDWDNIEQFLKLGPRNTEGQRGPLEMTYLGAPEAAGFCSSASLATSINTRSDERSFCHTPSPSPAIIFSCASCQ